jgi:FAD/FMN-containing dehydrogenase
VDDPAELDRHGTDFWKHYKGVSTLLLRPADTAEVAGAVRLAAEHKVPLVPQAGNTGLVGGGIPDQTGRMAILSLARLDKIRSVDPAGDVMVAEAGCTLAAVQEAPRAGRPAVPLEPRQRGHGADRRQPRHQRRRHQRDPLRHGARPRARAGGGAGRRAGLGRAPDAPEGQHRLRPEAALPGLEGTLGVITAAALKLYPPPRERVAFFAAVPSPAAAVELLASARGRFGELVSAFELLAAACVDAAVAHVPGNRFPLESTGPWYVLGEIGWSLSEGLEGAADEWLVEQIEAGLVTDATRTQNDAQRASFWRMRESVSEGMTKLGGPVARNDVSVPVARIPELIERGQALTRASSRARGSPPSATSATATCTSTSSCRPTRPTWRARGPACRRPCSTSCGIWAARSAPSTASAGRSGASCTRASPRSTSS